MKICEKSLENQEICEKCLKNIKKNNIINKVNGKYECPECKKLFKETKYLDEHLKKNCRMNIKCNNIYRFNSKDFGKKIYGKGGGEIYIIQTEYLLDNYYKIGRTTNLYNRLRDYRCGSVLEPRLHYFYPFSNIVEADRNLKIILKNYNEKREIYNGEINIFRDMIKELQVAMGDKQIENFPEIRNNDISKCDYCNQYFTNKHYLFEHWNKCSEYKKYKIKL